MSAPAAAPAKKKGAPAPITVVTSRTSDPPRKRKLEVKNGGGEGRGKWKIAAAEQAAKEAAAAAGVPYVPKLEAKVEAPVDEEPEVEDSTEDVATKCMAQFVTAQGELTGAQMELPLDITSEQLQELINALLKNEEKTPYAFFLHEEEITANLKQTVTAMNQSLESVVQIIYQPQAVFRVRAVTRCTASLPGHTEAVLHVAFSPDGKRLASGSGDTTVRLWDLLTETPVKTCKGHKDWVLAVAWAPNGKFLASGCNKGEVRIWDGITGDKKGKPLIKHNKPVTCLAWEPFHSNPACDRVASGSRDCTIKVWDTVRGSCKLSMNGHRLPVTALKWGGAGLLYSASRDCSIKVWDAKEGKLVRSLDGHAHWVNSLSLNTDYVLRTGAYNEKGELPESKVEGDNKAAIEYALEKYNKVVELNPRTDAGDDGKVAKKGGELLVSGSDDFTLFLWDPTRDKKPLIRLPGHQQPINFVSFSPDGRYIASASFDKSVRIWNGITGRWFATLRAHVGAVYQVAWSADSRLLCSSSKDSTLKVWDLKTKKMKLDLPGHADEVFAVDWSPDGERVCSGGKDKVLKVWRS